jgi:hypothetical protein
MFCRLEELPGGRWHCPTCDPAGRRTLPLGTARRPCHAAGTRPLAASQIAVRILEAEIRLAVAKGELGVVLAEVEARLAACRACQEFRGMGCRCFSARYAPCRAWFWALVAAPGRAVEPCSRWLKLPSPSGRVAGGEGGVSHPPSSSPSP